MVMNISKEKLGVCIFLIALCFAATASAQTPQNRSSESNPPSESWAGQLDILTRWLEERRHESDCHEHCFVLDSLRLTGDISTGSVEFELNGSVLTEGSVAVPLFGPPNQVRLDGAVLDGQNARIGFDENAYFLFTDKRNFMLSGRLAFQGDRALFIAGPLNSMQAELTGGRVVEGEHLSGLSGSTIHFEQGEGADQQREGPTVFQLARAIRVGRQINFEYQLEMRSGNDLGVVRLPLRFGERVLEVTGSMGWRVDEGILLLPTAGRSAEINITGTLSEISGFSSDDRSTHEWWLFESDAEHRLHIEGEGRQFDSSESPIARTQASSRLFMLSRGQQMRVQVTRLVSAEVLGAVVRSHNRTVVLTRQGDLVSEDNLSYENNGIDYLLFEPRGRAIYLSTDDQAERIMHKQQGQSQMMIPLRTGTHRVKVQALAQHAIASLAGRLEVPMPEYPLTTSRTSMTLGLPRFVHPILFAGGDETRWFFGFGDLFAVFFAWVAAWLVLRGRRRRILGAFVIGGLWFISPGLYVITLVSLALGGGIWITGRLLQGHKGVAVIVTCALVGLAGIVGLASLITLSSVGSDAVVSRSAQPLAESPSYGGAQARSRGVAEGEEDRLGNRWAQIAQSGVLEGVTPVALPLPGYHRSAHAHRELVTEERPFQPVLYYLTDWAVIPLEAAWSLCLLLLGFAYRREGFELYRRFRERMNRPPLSQPEPAPESTDGVGIPESREVQKACESKAEKAED